ncbi:CobW family GTP-binding protein [Metabacillus herbersteinensis]|uniref:CobW family GTP-binding protein n=1 Tax=Metabacillus herbersteinensis TaxID=283816 RepID=A0ABV6GJZ0_9BACI
MKKIPVYVISGFLGSGKTTVLVQMVESFKNKGQQVGIILNELGDENVESHLFQNQKIYELLNGCICCTIQEDLKQTLHTFIEESEKNSVDVLLIEGTGVANPLEIKDSLLHPQFIETLELKSMIGIVDAGHYLEYQSVFASTREIRELLKDQITSADFIILNKIDVVSQKEVEKVSQKLKKIVKPTIEIVTASYGKVSLEKLVEQRQFVVNLDGKEHFEEHDHNHNHKHDHHHNHHSISALKIEDVPPIKKDKLEKWLKGIPNLIRAKGMIREGTTEVSLEIQFAANHLRATPLSESQPKTVLILIGYDLDKLAIKELYDRAFLENTLS